MEYKDVTKKMVGIARQAYPGNNIKKVLQIGVVDGRTIYFAIGRGGKVGISRKFYIKEDGTVHKLDIEEQAQIASILRV